MAQRLVVMMDDFGCGYSSLNMLKNIPVDVLKLDMRFLQFKEEERQKSANILEAIINHCRLRSLRNCLETKDRLMPRGLFTNRLNRCIFVSL